jgi:dolichyl-phosphate-mannose--protein O-mannosyl transferase
MLPGGAGPDAAAPDAECRDAEGPDAEDWGAEGRDGESQDAEDWVPGGRDAASQGATAAGSMPPMPGSAFWGWAGPLLITLFGAFLRFSRLGLPRAVVFDETYYVGDAWGILRHGVEIVHVKNANALLLRGNTHILAGTQAELVAHPPLGKIMIAAGEWLFGLTPFGWRFSVALIGSVSILLLARIVRRMTRSTLLGCVAGLLMALDGLEFVLSRTAILDIFVMFWVLAAFGLLVIDRDRARARLAAAADAGGPADDGGPGLGIRWLRVLAGVCLGCATASKWNGVWYILAFGGLAIAWDLGARRAAGFGRGLSGAARHDAKWLPLWFGLIPAAVYVASWTGWFASPDGYNRAGTALSSHHQHTSAIAAWLAYNKWMLQFGLGLHTQPGATEAYQSNPLGWLVLARPISFFSACLPAKGCGTAGSTEREVLAIGTPLIWWAATAAMLCCAVWWLLRRDWRAGSALIGLAAGWLPWIWFAWHDHRTEFYYYSVVFEPFLIIALTLCLGLIIGPARPRSAGRRAIGAVAAGGYLLAVLANFGYLYPALAAKAIPYASWLSRMWLRSWV